MARRSLPQSPEAFIFTSTWPWPGSGRSNSLNSNLSCPGRITPRKKILSKVSTSSSLSWVMRLAPVKVRSCAPWGRSFIMVSEPGGDRLTSSGSERAVVREGLARKRVGEEGFRWRGEDVSRIEGFSDAVFAFAVTLLVVSLEVPKTFDELLATMRGFFAFAICFALLLSVWYDHYKFFRRYGLKDTTTRWLNSTLLFLMLLYVYPLKFLFTMLIDQWLGFGNSEMIESSQIPLLMVIYGAGFVAIQLVFFLMYLRAYSLRTTLQLDPQELSVTREEMQGFFLNVLVGLVSVAIAALGGDGAITWAGLVYLLVFPLQIINSRIMSSRRRRYEGARTKAEAGSEGP